jgi:hypothetical protein
VNLSDLEDLLLRINNELHEKQGALRQLMEDVQRLGREAQTLENARELMIKNHIPRAPLAEALKASQASKKSLQEEVIDCLEAQGVDEWMGAAEITHWLKDKDYHQADKKHFYIMVYNTLKRLFAKGFVQLNTENNKYALSTEGRKMLESRAKEKH